MEIRELAERVLFADTLEEKLTLPSGILTDLNPGAAISAPERPGRPEELRMHTGPNVNPAPRVTQLEDETDRATLLHFFANHELLAAELMALALLKFPDAPIEFRLGVAQTLREEQIHTRLYMDRMRECGVAFGSLRVNGFFWKAVAPMSTPLDYVSRLSLTFEQANLDYSRYFAEVFRQAGDLGSARILGKIYRDEIGHVGYGLKWFRRWKPSQRSDWSVFRSMLDYPLSPQRAKGLGEFNREGRLRAGFDEAFIDQLEVFSQSRGRTSNVYCFNPEAEWHVARASQSEVVESPPEALRRLAEDLSSLMLVLARRDDIAIVDRKPSLAFLKQLQEAGAVLPEIIERSNLDLAERKLGSLRPWAWSPDSLEFLRPFLAATTIPQRVWRPEWRRLHSKVFSAELRAHLGFAFGAVCETRDALNEALATFPRPLVLKSPFGLAGKGMLHLSDEGALPKGFDSWTEGMLASQGALLVEPWLERVLDFSVQYEWSADREGLRMLDFTRLHNDAAGRFLGCTVGRAITYEGDVALRSFFHGNNQCIRRFYEEILPEALAPHLRAGGFEGALGVDALIYRDERGALAHLPIVEINPRYTMGRVALEAGRLVHKGIPAHFKILSRRHLKASNALHFADLAERLLREHPVKVHAFANGQQRLTSGTLCLNDPLHARDFLAVLQVGGPFDTFSL